MDIKFLLILAFFAVSTTSKPLITMPHLTLKYLGSYRGIDHEAITYEKKYYVSNYLKLAPPMARAYCKSFGVNFDLVAFEDRNEFLVVRSKFEPVIKDKDIFVVVGAFADTDAAGVNHFHWIANGIRLFSPLDVEPDRKCLGIKKDKNNPVAFHPISCEQSMKFMCQEMEYQYTNE